MAVAGRAKSLMRTGWVKARAMGHHLEPIQPDVVELAYVSMCWTCGQYLAVDMNEHDHAYGGVLEGPCTRKIEVSFDG